MPSATPHHQSIHPHHQNPDPSSVGRPVPPTSRPAERRSGASQTPAQRHRPASREATEAPLTPALRQSAALGPAWQGERPPVRVPRSPQRNPRVSAALSYAVPVVPALILLARERQNHFIRLHAARSLVFFGLLGLAQTALFIVLVAVGGLISNQVLAVMLGLVFDALFGLLAIAGFVLWLMLLADAMAGRMTAFPLLGTWAPRLERLATRAQRTLPLRAHA